MAQSPLYAVASAKRASRLATFSSGTVHAYKIILDPSTPDLAEDHTVSVTISEKALGDRDSCGRHTAEDPRCARLTIAGKMTMVPEDKKAEAMSWMLAKHPEMADWPRDFNLY